MRISGPAEPAPLLISKHTSAMLVWHWDTCVDTFHDFSVHAYCMIWAKVKKSIQGSKVRRPELENDWPLYVDAWCITWAQVHVHHAVRTIKMHSSWALTAWFCNLRPLQTSGNPPEVKRAHVGTSSPTGFVHVNIASSCRTSLCTRRPFVCRCHFGRETLLCTTSCAFVRTKKTQETPFCRENALVQMNTFISTHFWVEVHAFVQMHAFLKVHFFLKLHLFVQIHVVFNIYVFVKTLSGRSNMS